VYPGASANITTDERFIRYPGLHCDVEAYIYLPLLEETGYIPPKKYVSGVEIRAYLEDLAHKFGLEDKILYRTQIDGLQWDDKIHAWKADMTSGRGSGGQEKSTVWMNAEFVFLATGVFPRPQVPKLPGLVGFEGAMFHTARWDYKVTGGSSDTAFPELDKLRGKRVGIIGTGATAIQIVPEVAKYAKELFVFQRTPSQVNPRDQQDTDPSEFRENIAGKAGWQKARMENFAEHVALGSPDDHEDLVADGFSKLSSWCAIVGSSAFGTVTSENAAEHIGRLVSMDAQHSAQTRARVSKIVKDKETAEKLTPWYPSWCKRPTFSDFFLQAFNQENVHLVDTDGRGVDSATAQGLVVGGKEYPLDVLILSTGYRSPAIGAGDPAAKIGIDIVGRGGRSLTEKWTAQGPTTLRSK
jgi:cation diffusion facilitator CzcD-associated flavoprotein CzcO